MAWGPLHNHRLRPAVLGRFPQRDCIHRTDVTGSRPLLYYCYRLTATIGFLRFIRRHPIATMTETGFGRLTRYRSRRPTVNL